MPETITQSIRAGGYDGFIYELQRKGKPIRLMQSFRSFRDELVVVTGGRPPHKPGSTGRIATDRGKLFPGVIDAEWVRISR